MIAEWFNSVFAVFRTIQINDIIDILAVTFIVFNLFKLVRETRAEQLLKGRRDSARRIYRLDDFRTDDDDGTYEAVVRVLRSDYRNRVPARNPKGA